MAKVGTPLGNLYRVNNGIATLKNNVYIIDYISEDESNYILGLREGQIFCLLGLVTAGTLLYRRHKKAKTPISTAKTT